MTIQKLNAEMFGVDWGLSRFRLWALRGGRVIGEVQNNNGAAMMKTAADYENTLLKAAAPWLPKNIKDKTAKVKVKTFICGMAGARDGWRQTPYRFVPCSPLHPVSSADGLLTEVLTGRFRVFLLPGLAQQNPPNVMRGEETQIAGLLSAKPKFDGAVCLPGSHAKWVRVRGGRVGKFDTMMTGEMYALLSKHSALHSVVKTIGKNGQVGRVNFDNNCFMESADEVLRRPSLMMAKLFSVRAASLLKGLSPPQARARLSGLCIGADIAAASNYYKSGEVVIIGDATIGKLYRRALTLRGIDAKIMDGKKAALMGLQTIAII